MPSSFFSWWSVMTDLRRLGVYIYLYSTRSMCYAWLRPAPLWYPHTYIRCTPPPAAAAPSPHNGVLVCGSIPSSTRLRPPLLLLTVVTGCMYIYIIYIYIYGYHIHVARLCINRGYKVANPARGQLKRENEYQVFPCHLRSRLRIWSRETTSAVPPYGIPPDLRGGVHLFV